MMKIDDSCPMRVRDMAILGRDELRRLAGAGELSRDVLALAADGAASYLGALADGDVASAELARMRVGSMASGCIHCPSHTLTETEMEIEGGIVFKVWCGKSLRPNMGGGAGARPTCGCLVGLKINGKAHPGPKVWVGSEKCPQGLW